MVGADRGGVDMEAPVDAALGVGNGLNGLEAGQRGPRWNRIEAESLPVGRDRVPNLWRVEGLE
ncbi:conserved hypothetical protein [Streptomyces lividans TK24]|nr:conserved hypothetical protein [Streptomyces lividans TK24]